MKMPLLAFLIVLTIGATAFAQEHTRPAPTPTPRAVAIPSATPVNDTGGWVAYNDDLGHFSVLMPEIPTDKAETTQSEHGPYTTHLFIVRSSPSVFLLGYVDYDPNFNFNLAKELEANRDNFVKGIKATLANSRALTIGGYQGLEFTAETADRTFTSRVLMVGRRPYQIVIGSPKGVDDSVERNRFFNSFKVRPR